MAKFHVTVRRVEEVTYEVDATDSAAAEANYGAADEVHAETVETTVTNVEEIS